MAPRYKKPDHLEVVPSRDGHTVRPPKLLKHIQQHASEGFVRLIEHMFAATDDLFYDLSKRASSNNEENLYFESMREIRIKKQGVSNAFLHEFDNYFTSLLSDQGTEEHRSAEEEPSSSSLSLVEGDELEIDLALNNMKARTRDTYKEELYELTIRLDHLLMQYEVTEENNPLDPQQLANAFVDACEEQLSINIKTRLILFKLFEKHVLKQLGHIYSDANQLLIDAGILPKVPKNLDNRGADKAEPHSVSSDAAIVTPSPDPSQQQINFRLDIGSLSALMASARSSNTNIFAASRAESGNGRFQYYTYANNPGPLMASPELAALLSKTQPIVDKQLAANDPKNLVGEIVRQLLARRDPATPQALEQPDEDIINLVAMFFDTILEDENLPIAVQSLVCRLQIPILRVALKDKTFLTNEEHPARKLINVITHIGISFDDTKPLERDQLYLNMVEGVQTINRQYKTNEQVFSTVYDDLKQQWDKESRKSVVVEQRIQQAEEGKSKIKNARDYAQTSLYEKMRNTELPDAISSFLTNTWLQVLVITYLKSGDKSPEWIEADQLASDLIWLCQKHESDRSIARAQRLTPEVLDRIETGLEAAIDNPETRSSKVSQIEEVLSNLNNNRESIEYRQLDENQKQTLGRSESDQKSWEEMTALERQQSKYEELSSQFYLKAKDMPEGVWIEYTDEQTGTITRCKLSAKINSDTYLFVNRLGLKVLEKTRRQFAYDMQFKRARILDSTPVFERLMDKIVSHLTQAA
ncbi:DUF1631 domain-containing protein [Teredinibacter sp. KSP-S5-2]|uniref:DUF1631 domain-containing protein n=1 Tax=Teredinibacter sp. KSP-S5-2 TaxID=3034506 RepID=UPI002934FDE2|nr:DUF1631 domain-containing protein [Teredinibacter sp. KSP-S5-2]WNO08586.1 DUF1631 domain-containing protein [Teredinibacter sp. KSP-S5-2]